VKNMHVPTNEPAAGGGVDEPAEQVAGTRSSPRSPSVLAEPAQQGSTGSTLRQLSSDIGDTGIVAQFVADYLRLLDGRLSRLDQLLSSGQTDSAVVALLSLETSSAMVGGWDVVAAAQTLRSAVETALTDRDDSARTNQQHDHDTNGAAEDLFHQLVLAARTTRSSLSDVNLTHR
jgi:hypothetical protein